MGSGWRTINGHPVYLGNEYTDDSDNVAERRYELNGGGRFLHYSVWLQPDVRQRSHKATCPVCGERCYFVRSNGGCFWCDVMGYPWTIHPCMAGIKESSQREKMKGLLGSNTFELGTLSRVDFRRSGVFLTLYTPHDEKLELFSTYKSEWRDFAGRLCIYKDTLLIDSENPDKVLTVRPLEQNDWKSPPAPEREVNSYKKAQPPIEKSAGRQTDTAPEKILAPSNRRPLRRKKPPKKGISPRQVVVYADGERVGETLDTALSKTLLITFNTFKLLYLNEVKGRVKRGTVKSFLSNLPEVSRKALLGVPVKDLRISNFFDENMNLIYFGQIEVYCEALMAVEVRLLKARSNRYRKYMKS